MIRQSVACLLVGVFAGVGVGQAPKWNWKTGQVLTYRVDQSTVIVDQVEDSKAESTTKLQLVKRWQVADVDASGVATLELTLQSLSMKSTLPDGEALEYDSAKPEKATPGLRDSMGKYVGKKLAVLRIDTKGKVVEVKESNFGPKSRYINELPFVGLLPAAAPQVGASWTRDYELTLAPPQGANEKTPAKQKYTCKSLNNASLVVSMTTALAKPPEAAADRIPWLQYLPKGELTYDLQAGRLQKAELTIDEKIDGHQGEKSSYTLRSTYQEVYVGK